MAKNIIPVWQDIGYSTHWITKHIGELKNTKATHTGTLDPMACGVILVLVGEERFNKEKYTESTKTYEFEISFGIDTDSYDSMGMIKKTLEDDFKYPRITEIRKILRTFKGEYIQRVPLFSAIKYKGRRLFQWGHEKDAMGTKVDIKIDINDLPKKKGYIHGIKLIDFKKENLLGFVSNTIHKLEGIDGDFRQERIIKRWKQYLHTIDHDQKITTIKIHVETTRGIYIRSLANDICNKLDTSGFVSSLVRTKNGKYTKRSCKRLEKLFGKDFDKNMFVGKGLKL